MTGAIRANKKYIVYIKRIYHFIKFFYSILLRNKFCLNKVHAKKNQVNLEWVDNGNLGDSLGPLIYRYMLRKKEISEDTLTKKAYHLFTCGSLIGVGTFDVVVWGSGIHIVPNIKNILSMKGIRKYDIRAVRGPVTRQILIDCGYWCPEIYGDPGVI